MGGGGKGSTPSQITANPDPAVSGFTNEVRGQSRPVREEVYSQIGEALRTGGIGARIPIIQKSVEASKSATSRAMTGLDEAFAKAGPTFANSPYAQRIKGQTALAGAQSTEAIGPSIAKEFIDIAPSVALGSSSQIFGGLGQASSLGLQGAIAGQSLNAQRDIAKGNQMAQIYTALIQGASGAGNSAGAAAACWIAARLYGRWSLEFYAARRFVLRHRRLLAVYRWCGPRVARSRFVWMLRPAFDLAVARGM